MYVYVRLFLHIFAGKRKLNNTVAEALLESRKVAEENKEKRFKRKMEAKEKLMEKLDKILEKI